MFCFSTSNRLSLFLSPTALSNILFHRFMGGNSTKATSGINGAGTNAQKELNIPDSAKVFFDDTKKSVCSPISHLSYIILYIHYRPANLPVMTSLKSLLD